MAQYVRLSIPEADLGNVDVEFHAHDDQSDSREVIGKLKVSKGGIEWVPKYKQHWIKKDWKAFARLMENDA